MRQYDDLSVCKCQDLKPAPLSVVNNNDFSCVRGAFGTGYHLSRMMHSGAWEILWEVRIGPGFPITKQQQVYTDALEALGWIQ